jgi:uncharacterized cupin superfamily protein
MIYQAILKIRGKEIPILYYNYRCHIQHHDDSNLRRIIQLHIQVCEEIGNRENLPVEGDLITLAFECSGDEAFFYDWLNGGTMQDGEIHFIYNEVEVADIFRFWDCYCVKIEEYMSIGNAPMMMVVYLSPGIIKRNNLEVREKVWKVSNISLGNNHTVSKESDVSHSVSESSSSAISLVISTIHVKPPFKLKRKFQNNPHYEKEMRRQLKMQEDGINKLTIFEWLSNRRAFKEKGRSSESKEVQETVRKAYYAKKMYEYISLAGENYDLSEIESKVNNELDELAALHNPDQIAGGNVKDVKEMGNKRINSSIGSQWGTKDKGRAQYIEDEILKILAGPPEIKEEQQKKINMNVIFANELELIN